MTDETQGEGRKTPMQLATEWYPDGEVERYLQRYGEGKLVSFEDAVPTDIFSHEFAAWLTTQYRLAMAKGIQREREVSRSLTARIAELEGIIATHDLCHDLHGKVGREEFEEGCRREATKHFGGCGWAEKITTLTAQLAAAQGEVAKLTDAEVSQQLAEAGIDMRPAIARLHDMLAPHKALAFLERLGFERGAIVSSADCSPMELAFARKEDRFFVDSDGIGYVLRMKEWRELAEQSITRTQR